jgi:hypothetical protein
MDKHFSDIINTFKRLDELSNDTLGNYKKAAAADATAADKRGDYAHGDRRYSGIIKATKKQFANDTKSRQDEEKKNSHGHTKKQQAAIAIAKQFGEGLNEYAADGDNGGGEDNVLHKYARMWWNGDEATQLQIEKILDRMGWEIGEDEGSYENGGVFVVRAGDEHGRSYESWPAEDLTEGMAEDSMSQAEHHASGARFGGYWRGTDSGTPRAGQGVGASESIEEEIAREWNTYLVEFGAGNTGGGTATPSAGTTGASTVDQAKNAKELADISKGVNKAKSAGVLPNNASTTQSSQTIAAGVSDMSKATPQQKKEMGMAAQGFNDFVKAASTTTQGQGALNTVLSAMKKVKMNPGA